MRHSPSTAREIENEVQVMEMLQGHPNIVQLHCATRGHGLAFLVMEYLDGGDLFKYAFEDRQNQFLSEARVQQLLGDMTEGIRSMYDLNILHNDLKPENFLMTSTGDDAVLKIADFGSSVVHLPHDRVYRVRGQDVPGTPQFMVSVPVYTRAAARLSLLCVCVYSHRNGC